MSSILTGSFWRAAAERAAKTAAQAAVLALAQSQVTAGQLNAAVIDWATVGWYAAGGAVLSVLTSVASSQVGGAGPSLGPEKLAPAPHVVPAAPAQDQAAM